MRNRVHRLGVALVAALLLLGPAAAVQAGGEKGAGEEISLIGQLNTDESGGYVLIEQESGDSIALEGSAELADHVGSTVRVTGKWTKDAEGNDCFEVSQVERVG